MKTKLLILSIALAVTTFSCTDTNQNEIKVVSPEEMKTLLELEDVQLVDVRTPDEYKTGYIEYSQNINFLSPTFEDDILNLDKTKPVLVYCKSGKRSAKCSKKLKAAGFVKIYDLEGGIAKWKYKGNEIKTIE
ncbi:rhodanese-like domain-containing protein [Psychroserpens sp.]|uniref:rhodanese-like domain-containing protein n=1 Tax=Psychroserpens sp. TaxID=2020870 RepID=UPI001B295C0F|nr:rhodanese-like domain-containing protein [Psychroserpens sp.]MBO6606084.1 rhodanese-like domain-containing protein [Psychroserpens sp.]MBO6631860.1 rhodanese-like domain-containing protein [Psychroserpens sp.]MBO6652545.1 rhodanese-like domain-containing protein [Psychroserpens sp.]MBO6681683.1 rhodanese-like domain-containing protein [Psychroserpens sp.]MBO6749458.1 rhodanese-like domain-containing protein [Psychroserpens sp.]